ncbi:hypothetical protein ACFO6V_25210 [Promicromonospora alba]|uniref:Acetyltransferase (GNAT) family protein n=1 Tax=Promicromonospora alba TaxID=1616110 RepID=A0ABV9HN80_9MICO
MRHSDPARGAGRERKDDPRVFGFNTGAHGLYESLGYETTTIKMHKRLGRGHSDS